MVLSDKTIRAEIDAGRMSNVADLPITIYQGMPIGQLSFMRMDLNLEGDGSTMEPTSRPEGS